MILLLFAFFSQCDEHIRRKMTGKYERSALANCFGDKSAFGVLPKNAVNKPTAEDEIIVIDDDDVDGAILLSVNTIEISDSDHDEQFEITEEEVLDGEVVVIEDSPDEKW